MGWSATGWGGRLWSLVQPNGLDKPVQSVGRLNDSARERAFTDVTDMDAHRNAPRQPHPGESD
jgi:hypothetical protein